MPQKKNPEGQGNTVFYVTGNGFLACTNRKPGSTLCVPLWTPKAELKAQLQAQVSSTLNPLFRIHDVVAVPEMPKTATFKIMRRSLRAGYHVEGGAKPATR